MRKSLTLTLVLGMFLWILPLAGATATGTSNPLVFHSLDAPCVAFDTRPGPGSGAGPLISEHATLDSMAFDIVGAPIGGPPDNFESQGGTPGGCGIPGYESGNPITTAVLMNLVAINPSAGGNLRAYPTDATGTGGIVNYQGLLSHNLNNSNAFTLPVRQDTQGQDITIEINGAAGSTVHARGIILGYFTPASHYTEPETTPAGEIRPNVVGGSYTLNGVAGIAFGATIAGGGGDNADLGYPAKPAPNTVYDHFGTIGGGFGNVAGNTDLDPANAALATVGGGSFNDASARSSTVGGGASNSATAPSATVGGGQANAASNDHATVGGGFFNNASGPGSTVGGGNQNSASGGTSTVGGGHSVIASGDYATAGGGRYSRASGDYSVVGGGGYSNIAWRNLAQANWTTVAGGAYNRAYDTFATIAGGFGNRSGMNDGDAVTQSYATVGGGISNEAWGVAASVAGGRDNSAEADHATVGGGASNIVYGEHGTIGGGGSQAVYADGNRVFDDYGTVGGGVANRAGSDDGETQDPTNQPYATVGGGVRNTASGWTATVPGGVDNTASGSYSFAAGRRAQATHEGSFVWADSTFADFASGADNEFSARAAGGYRFATDTTGTVGAALAAGSTSWSVMSDSAIKENFAASDPQQILEAVAGMDVGSWNYITQDESIRHIGPVAQDFYAAFGVGESETHISTVDADGVALAAIQGLYAQNQALQAQMDTIQGPAGGSNGIPVTVLLLLVLGTAVVTGSVVGMAVRQR